MERKAIGGDISEWLKNRGWGFWEICRFLGDRENLRRIRVVAPEQGMEIGKLLDEYKDIVGFLECGSTDERWRMLEFEQDEEVCRETRAMIRDAEEDLRAKGDQYRRYFDSVWNGLLEKAPDLGETYIAALSTGN